MGAQNLKTNPQKFTSKYSDDSHFDRIIFDLINNKKQLCELTTLTVDIVDSLLEELDYLQLSGIFSVKLISDFHDLLSKWTHPVFSSTKKDLRAPNHANLLLLSSYTKLNFSGCTVSTVIINSLTFFRAFFLTKNFHS